MVLCATLPLVTASLFLDQDADEFWEPMSANTTLKPHLEGTPPQWRATVVFPDHPFLDKKLTTNIGLICCDRDIIIA
ncbi:hypothetical protein [Microcoleus sp. AR_TQ3_B6]|uniref:hypothetical protein n=1 Tax=Microcoleus sp. AR_TQ3_B6 TaxID=3055284 RepID=UPI002FD6F5CE